MSRRPAYYLPITDADVSLEGCETLLRSLLERIIERYINGRSNYTDEVNVIRVRILKLEIEFHNYIYAFYIISYYLFPTRTYFVYRNTICLFIVVQ